MDLQQRQHALVIGTVHKDGLAVITSQNDVVRVVGKGESG
jgi:hypothetical protein